MTTHERMRTDAKAQELTWSPQEIKTAPTRSEPAEQVAMFSPGGCSMKQEANLKADPLLSAIGCQIGVGCMESSSKKKPVCSPEQKTKRESCIIQVKAKLPAGCNRKEWSKPQNKRMDSCYNPFSVCTSAIGCRLGTAKLQRPKLIRHCVDTPKLKLNEYSCPKTSGRLRGISVGRDRDGYFVMTHRARSKSYPEVKDIPEKTIAFIKSTS